MLHNIMAEFLGTALMILFGVGVHCDEVLNKTKYGEADIYLQLLLGDLALPLFFSFLEVFASILQWHWLRQFWV